MFQRVFVDANVLVSKTTRDWLLLVHAVLEGMFQLHTTEDVFAEVFRTIRKKNPRLDGGAITRIRHQLVTSFDELIEDFDGSTPFPGRDEGDIHVHAAAVASKAHIVLSSDNGFTDIDPDLLPYEVFKPDEFFMLIQSSAPNAVREVTSLQVQYWQKKKGSKTLVQALIDARCPVFAAAVEEHLRVLSGLKSA